MPDVRKTGRIMQKTVSAGDRLSASAFYFLFYAAAASLVPFLVIFYHEKAVRADAIGVLGAIPPLMMLFGAPLWSGLADALRRHRQVLVIAIVGSILFVGFLYRASTLLWIAVAVAGYSFFSSPIMPLVDSSTLASLGSEKARYGQIRIWGAAGWGIAAPIVGDLYEHSGLHWPFLMYAGLLIAALIVAARIPLGYAQPPISFGHETRSIRSSKPWALFLFIVLVCGTGLSGQSVFLFLYMDHLGASRTLMGLALTAATLSELPFLFYSNRLIRRWGPKRLLLFGVVMIVIRALLYSVVRQPWMVLLVQLLHGPTFSAIWVAGVSYADELAPTGLATTAQGLFNATFMGLGAAFGALLAGILYQNFGPDWMYRGLALLVLLGLLVYSALDGIRRTGNGAR